MSFKTLLSRYNLKGLELKSRMVMAPMTRSRSQQPGNIPTELMGQYYAQRSGAGLIISEATQISPQGQGYSFTPGIYSAEQIEGWSKVTDAVHQNNGSIYCQLWHVGRMSHPVFHQGQKPVAPSALAPNARVWVSENGVGQMWECPQPRALEITEITTIIMDYVRAARNAMQAGFDGVEIHAANGYLVDQFMRTSSNVRTDEYGGDMEGRLRFVKQILRGICAAIGAGKVGIRIAPFIKARGMECPEILTALLNLADYAQDLGIAYIHLSEADWDDAPVVPDQFRDELRQRFSGAIIGTGHYSPDKAEDLLQKGSIDLAGFGRPFISNPDYPYRVQHGLPLNDLDPSTLFGGDARGYTDYPMALQQSL